MDLGRVSSSARFSKELLRLARAGDTRALNRLFAGVLPQLRRWAHRRVPGWARSGIDTADIVQETMIHTMRNLASFEPQREDALLRYLRRSLMNRVRDQFRSAERHPRGELCDVYTDPAPSPLDFVIAEENRARYAHALSQLRSADRTAIIGRVELGYTYEQLALVLDKPTPGAARIAVRRALQRLADQMRLG